MHIDVLSTWRQILLFCFVFCAALCVDVANPPDVALDIGKPTMAPMGLFASRCKFLDLVNVCYFTIDIAEGLCTCPLRITRPSMLRTSPTSPSTSTRRLEDARASFRTEMFDVVNVLDIALDINQAPNKTPMHLTFMHLSASSCELSDEVTSA